VREKNNREVERENCDVNMHVPVDKGVLLHRLTRDKEIKKN
jgi:hypothetical protein